MSELLEGWEEESNPDPLIPARAETKGTGRRGLKKRLVVRVFWRAQTCLIRSM